MEGSILELLLEYGTVGALAAVGFWLYIRERRISAQHAKDFREMQAQFAEDFREMQVSETKAKYKLAHMIEDLNDTIGELMGEFKGFLETEKLERAKEEGRREVTGKHRLPIGGEDEPL